MNRPVKTLMLVLAMLAAGWLAAGCAQGSNVKNAVASASPSKSFTFSPPTISPRATRTASDQPSEEPTTHAAAPAPAPSSQASAAASKSAAANEPESFLWLWIVLGVVVIAVVVYLVARRSGRRSTITSDWRSGVADASAKGWALSDAIGMAEAPEDVAPGSGARWADNERRADDLAQTLYRLRETAPGEAEAARVSDVLAALQGLRAAINAERSPTEPGPPDHARVRGRLAFFEASLNALSRPTQHGDQRL
jgi:hypothetical protein